MTHSQPGNMSSWNITEIFLLPFILCYFLLYPRDTISDSIICSSLCFLILAFRKKIKLNKPDQMPFKIEDLILLSITIPVFISAWVFAWKAGKLNKDSALLSIQVTVLYFYYAWIQHFLAQRYTAMRILLLVDYYPKLRELSLPKEIKAALLTGIVFGILHIPYPGLMAPAAIGGSAYAYYFLMTGRLWAVVSSHALIASAWIFWGLDSNAFEEFTFLF